MGFFFYVTIINITSMLLITVHSFKLKKSLLDHLVQLLSCGHILSVVDYVTQCTEPQSVPSVTLRPGSKDVLIKYVHLQ